MNEPIQVTIQVQTLPDRYCVTTVDKIGSLLLLLVGGLVRGVLLLFSSLLGINSGSVISLLLLGVPLAGLENENSDKNKSENGVAGGKNLQAVLTSQNKLAGLTLMGLAIEAVVGPDLGTNASKSLDNVGDVDTETNEVEDERCAVKEEVGLAGTEELDEEANKADGDDHVKKTANERRRLVHKLQMRFEVVKEVVRHGSLGPKKGEIVRERCEENAQEEADS